jgi:hypothetical protein
MNVNIIAPKAKNGPKGILVVWRYVLISLFCCDKMSVHTPYTEPSNDPMVILIQQPIIPVKDPINKRRSKSPSPIPSMLRKYLKILLMKNKKR